MEKILVLLKEIVSFVKIYGVDGVYWLIVLAYIVGVIYPEFSHEVISSSNIVVLGIIWLGTKLIKDNSLHSLTRKKEMNIRMKANYNVNTELLKLKYETHADRVFIGEFHNGKCSMQGLPFIYFDINYEQSSCKVTRYIGDEYQNMNVSLYNFTNYLVDNYYFSLTTKQLEEIDPKVARRMDGNGTKYVACALLKCEGVEIGFLGVSYETEEIPITPEELHSKITLYAQDIANFLNYEQSQKNAKKK